VLKLLYLSDCYVEASIFASQVHSLCEHQSDFLEVNLLAHTHGAVTPSRHRYGLQLRRWVPNMSMPLIAASVGAYYGLTGIVRGYDVAHCRGHVMSFVAIVARAISRGRIKIVADIRGESAAEMAGGGSSALRWLKQKSIRCMERVIFRNADHICFVSEAMREHFCDMYTIAPSKISIFPTLVNTLFFQKSAAQRMQKRAELRLRDDQVLYVYSGGVSRWQNVDKIIARFSSIAQDNDKFMLLVLTTAPDVVRGMIADVGANSERIVVRKVSYNEVGAYLNAADAGLLIRDDSAINRVASPTKANEYFACGLPVIDDLQGIGETDFSAWTRSVTTFKSLDDVAAGHRDIYEFLCLNNSNYDPKVEL